MTATSTVGNEPISVGILGCGAITEMYHGPAFQELEKTGAVRVTALLDPDPKRVTKIREYFPAARACSTLAEFSEVPLDAAIVASPPRYHAEQAVHLLRRKIAVLCEKPIAATVRDAESMLRAAAESKTILAVGLLRRFFPALRSIRQIIASGALGPVQSFRLAEGGSFGWPAQSASFFQRAASGGGVLLDVGVHVLDLAQWWFGDPAEIEYEDDAVGGLEANCLVRMRYPNGCEGEVRLSRDTPLANRYEIECERGSFGWTVMNADHFDFSVPGLEYVFTAEPQTPRVGARGTLPGESAGSFYASFMGQLLNFVEAVRGRATVEVSGDEGIKGLRLIEQCYRNRTLMKMDWLSEGEASRARELQSIA